MKTALLIDGNGLIHRAYHALPPFKTKEGVQTNAVYGFATMLYKTIKDFSPSHMAVFFDTKAPTFRKKMFEQYQAQRPEVDEQLKGQFSLVKEFLRQAHISYFEKDGYEADDLIGTAAQKLKAKKFRVLILSGDKDMVQLVDEKTYFIALKKGLSQVKIYDQEEAEKEFKVRPQKMVDLKSLMGDPSDNYKGVTGVGPKTAANLINKYGSIENIYQKIDQVKNKKIRQSLIKDKENALLAKKLAKIVQDVDFDFKAADSKFEGFAEDLKDYFKKLEFKSLIKRYFEKNKKNSSQKRKKNGQQTSLF